MRHFSFSTQLGTPPLTKVYDCDGVTTIDIRGLSEEQVVRQVAHVVHMDAYKPADLQGRLVRIQEVGYSA